MPQINFHKVELERLGTTLAVSQGLNGAVCIDVHVDGEPEMRMTMNRDAFPKYLVEQLKARELDILKDVYFPTTLNIAKGSSVDKIAETMLRNMK